MSKLLDIHDFCEDLKEIKTSKIINNRGRFTEDGLFSEQIFGPVKNYTCQCGTFYGLSGEGEVCKICGVEITNCGERRKRFAKIKLPLPVMNPIFYDLISSLCGSKIKSLVDILISNERSILYKKGEKYLVTDDPNNIPSDSERWDKMGAVIKLLYETSKYKLDDPKWKYIYDNIHNVLINEVIVLPADLRPASKITEKNNRNQIVDKINRFYIRLLTKKEIMANTNYDIANDKKIYYQYYHQLQKDVNELYGYILSSMSEKDGLIRGHILGKRIDFSGRAVITPDPMLKLDECILPYSMILELFKIDIAKEMTYRGIVKFLNSAIQILDQTILTKSYYLFEFVKEYFEQHPQVCIINRQPSLHRLGMLGFKIKLDNNNSVIFEKKDDNNETVYRIHGNNTIKIHPLVCGCFNADFDGDQMAVYVPISEESKQEVYDKFLITKNLSNPANGLLTTTHSQDMILGIYALTSNQFPKLKKMVVCKGQKITESRKIFNDCLPNDYPIIDKIISKKELLNILEDIKSKYDYTILAEILDQIKNCGFKYATLFGPTMSLDSFELKDDSLKKELYESDNIVTQLNKISSLETENFLKENFNYSYMISSGSRGTWDQARQIILSRGFISNFKGEIIPTPVKSSLLDGLTPEEFFISTYGCRKGLLDVALNTGESGYLSRKLNFSCVNLQKDLDLEDCGTRDHLTINVDSVQKAEMLLYRYYLNDNNEYVEITKENYKNLIGKIILLRSPIYCRSNKICHKCYGNLYKILNSKYIGIIAAQTLGERSTQLILRTFHTSGVANIRGAKSDGDLKQDDIVADLSVACDAFHHFSDNQIPGEMAEKLFKIYNNNGKIHHIHIEAVISQLMWSGYTKWRLVENRENVKPEWHSIQQVPAFESWILSLGFSDPKRSIIKGLFEVGQYSGIIDKILLGEKIK